MIPDIETFTKAVRQYRGNLSKVADAFGVSRTTVNNWKDSNEEYKDAVQDARLRLFDNTLGTAEIMAMGIPERDENGKFIGWVERPDPSIVKYILGSLGRKEGFGDTLDITTNGKDVGGITVEVIDRREQVEEK